MRSFLCTLAFFFPATFHRISYRSVYAHEHHHDESMTDVCEPSSHDAIIRQWLLRFRNQSRDESRPSFRSQSHRASSSSFRASSHVSPPCSLVAHPSVRASPPSSLGAHPSSRHSSCPSCARAAPPLYPARCSLVLRAAPMRLLFLMTPTSAIQVPHAMFHLLGAALPLPLHVLPPAPRCVLLLLLLLLHYFSCTTTSRVHSASVQQAPSPSVQ